MKKLILFAASAALSLSAVATPAMAMGTRVKTVFVVPIERYTAIHVRTLCVLNVWSAGGNQDAAKPAVVEVLNQDAKAQFDQANDLERAFEEAATAHAAAVTNTGYRC